MVELPGIILVTTGGANLEHLPELASAKGSLKRLVKPGVRSDEFLERLEHRVRVVHDLNTLACRLLRLYLSHAYSEHHDDLHHFDIDQDAVLAAYDVLHEQTAFSRVRKPGRMAWIDRLRPFCQQQYASEWQPSLRRVLQASDGPPPVDCLALVPAVRGGQAVSPRHPQGPDLVAPPLCAVVPGIGEAGLYVLHAGQEPGSGMLRIWCLRLGQPQCTFWCFNCFAYICFRSGA
jgi:hypothetical protein